MSLYNDASLVMIPSAYKDGKLYSIKPTDGSGDFTFSRGSNLAATRVDENGLIEKGRENLLLQSNQFDTTWATSNASVLGGQIDKDGGSDAWLLSKSAASGYITQNTSLSGISTFSVYAKAGTNTHLAFWIRNANQGKFFDLVNGTIGSDYINTPIDAKIESVGNGWYRCSITTDDATNNCRIYPADADGDVSGTSGSIYIQDAQLEAGLVATDYIETTTTTAQAGILEDMPRLDYSGSCPSLLLEPQRTNELAHSEYIGAFGASNVSVTSNTEISPQGVRNAATIEVTTQTAVEGIAQGFVADGSSLYTISAYYKKTLSSTRAQLKIRDLLGSGTTYGFVDFDLSDGSVSASIGTYSITSFNDDWWYVAVTTSSAPSAGIRRAIVRLDNQPVGTQISVFGFQVESGSYPTSYIPCYGAATTRSQDSCSKTGISSLIGQEQGTIFVEATNFFASGLRTIATLWTSSSDFYQVYINASNQVRVDISGSFIFLGGSIAANTNYKIAFAYKSGEYALYINGTQIATSTNTTIPSSLTDYYLGNLLGGEQSGEFAQTALFKTRLTNGELAALTTL